MTPSRRRAAALGAAAALSLVLTACADDTTTSAPEAEPAMTESTNSASDPAPTSSEEVEGPFNDADVSFAQGMLPHHRQAVEMAEMVQGGGSLEPSGVDFPSVQGSLPIQGCGEVVRRRAGATFSSPSSSSGSRRT